MRKEKLNIVKMYSRRRLIYLFSIFFVSAVTIGILFFNRIINDRQEETLEKIYNAASRKSYRINNWYNYTFTKPHRFIDNSGMAKILYDHINQGTSLKNDNTLVFTLNNLADFSSLSSISVFDVSGSLLISAPAHNHILDIYKVEDIKKVIDTGKHFLTDLHFCAVDSSAHLSYYLPLERITDGKKKIFAVVMLDANPVTTIFTSIKNTPDETKPSESLTIKGDKEIIFSLSDFNFSKRPLLKHKTPLKVPDSFTSLRRTNFWEGTDFDGNEVLGVTRKIKNLPWFVSVQIDKEEVYNSIYEHAGLFLLFAIILLTASVILIYVFILSPQRVKKLDKNTHALHCEVFMENANDIIVLTDAEGNILEANKKAISVYGYTLEDLKELNVKDLRSKETQGTFQKDFDKSKTEDGNIYETIHVKKDGTDFPVEISSRIIVVDGKIYAQSIIRDITERKHAEEKLRQADLLLRLVIEGTKDVVFIKDTESKFLLINKVGALQIGKPIEQIIGRTNEELFGKEQAAKFNEIDKKIFTEGVTLNTEEEMMIGVKKIIISAIITPWRDSKGKIIGLIGISRDITEKQEMVNVLKQNEELLRTLFDTSAAGISLVGMDGRFVKVNKKICEMLGTPEEEIYKQNFRQYVYEEDMERANASIAKLFSGEIENLSIEARYVRKNGEVRSATSSISLVRNNDGNPLYLSGITVDNTEVVEAHTKLRESENKYRKIFEDIQDVFFITSNDGILLDISPSIERHAGYTREELLQRHVEGFYLNKEDRKEFLSKMQKYGEVNDFETRMKAKDGRIIHTAINAHFRRSDKGEIIGMEGSLRDISERKKAEEALKESEKKYRKVFENIQDVFFITDTCGILVDVSPSIKRYTEYTREEIIGKHVNEFYHDIQDKAEFLDRMKRFGEVSDFEIRMKTKSDKLLYASMNAHNRYNEHGQVIGMEGSLRNITERKKAEAELKANEKRYRQLFELNPHIMWLYDLHTLKFIAVNEAAIQHYGYSREEFLSMTIKDIRPAEDVTLLEKNLKNICHGIDHAGVWRHIKKDSTVISVDIVSHAVKFADIEAKLVLVTDVTEKLKAQGELVKLSRAVEQSTSSIMITDVNGNIEYVNKAFTKNTGYTFEEVKGKNPRFLKSGKTPDSVFKEMWDTILAGKDWHGELQNITKDGRLIWEAISITPILDKNGKIKNFVEIKDEITNQKQIQQELIEAKEKAEHSNKLKTQFLAQMSHEIRTPLNAMLSYSSLIKHELENLEITSGDIDESLAGITDSGRRIIRTIELILDISDVQTGRYEAIQKESFLYKDILHKIYAEYKSLAEEKKIEFKIEKNIDDPILRCDEYSLAKIFDHLIDNAIKFTHKGFVKVDISKNGAAKNILVRVKDSGIGISKEYLPKLFTAFSQEEQGYTRSFDGNGLGLALVKKYCELNKIKIDVQSEKGNGTTFLLTIPLDR